MKARILGEAAGNPLALIELPRGLTPAEVAGGFGLPDGRPLASRIEHTFLQRAQALPRETQLLLLTAAAEPLGDLSLLWRAADRLGIGGEAGQPAEAARLIELDARVRFPHPLVRSAVYRASHPSDRRDVHRALADSTDRVADPDRCAWHRAHATAVPDEEVAAEMARSAERAQGRGGLAAAAAFLQRAAELTPDPARRVERSLAAAQAKLDVADVASASDLLDGAALGPVDELQRARLERLGAQIAFRSQRGRGAAPLLGAARRLDPLDPKMARETYLEAIAAAMYAGRLGTGPDEREVAEAARTSTGAQAEGAADLLLDALVTRFTEGYAASVAPLSRALRAFGEPDGGGEDRRWLWLACRFAQDLWDDELWHALATGGVRLARDTGALHLLPNALNYLAALNVHSGAFTTAAAQIEEVRAITQATGLPPLRYGAGTLAAARGDQAWLQALADDALPGAIAHGDGSAIALSSWFIALMHNGHGRYDEALDGRAAGVRAHGRRGVRLGLGGAHRGRRPRRACGRGRRGTRAPERAHARERHRMGARDRGALPCAAARRRVPLPRVARTTRSAAARRSSSRAPGSLYGEWLRRENRRTDARELLREAHESFSHMGAAAFAERARRELLATGETVRRVTDDTRDDLTPQEIQVARLARDGHSNPEIGAQLFISPRTVEYHLRKVFRKLDVSSRKELRDAFADTSAQAVLGFV